MIGNRWGATDAEVARHYPCDDLVPHPAMQAWRAVTVHAEAPIVWRWVLQLRLAPYSYDWIDNLGRRSPQRLHDLAPPAVGDPFMSTAGRPLGRVLAVRAPAELTGVIVGATMSYVVVPAPATNATRLLLKIVMARGRLLAPAVSVGDLVMARRQLLNLARLAEGTPA